jgi:hypothetical protein
MMSESSVQERLARIAFLTDSVQAAINSGEWLQAAELDTARRTALEDLFQGLAAEPATVAHLRDNLEALSTRTQHMIGEVHHHKRRVAREASTVSLGRKASREYRAVSTDA